MNCAAKCHAISAKATCQTAAAADRSLIMSGLNFLGGKIRLAQAQTGHRAGTDAVLLASTVAPSFDGHIVDAGAASGAVGLSVAARAPRSSVELIEIDSEALALARDNVAANGMEHRVSVRAGDLLGDFKAREAAGLTAAKADLVLTNPPFFDENQMRVAKDPAKQRAHIMPENGLERWILACHALLKPKGELIMIHRADAVPALLTAMSGRFGNLKVLPVYPRRGSPATRILIGGVKESRAPFVLLPGLILHESDGKFTPETEALHRGTASLKGWL
jgi:tRNA1(Val) A37 N6-methylase TrmN6